MILLNVTSFFCPQCKGPLFLMRKAETEKGILCLTCNRVFDGISVKFKQAIEKGFPIQWRNLTEEENAELREKIGAHH